MSVTRRISDLRQNGWRRQGIAAAGALIGLVLATVHWTGFLVGGALVALPQRTVPRGIVVGTGFGLVVWGTFLATLALEGTAGAYLGMGQVFYLSVAIPVLAAFLGSLVRVLG
ncbi:MAG: hypothetical protein ACOCSN_05895 [Halanaeroarchaeum sp.]